MSSRSFLAAAIVTILGLCQFLWGPSIQRGTAVCLRCGAECVAAEFLGIAFRPEPGPSVTRAWAALHLGACQEHAWRRSGCWYSSSTVYCTIVPDGHALLSALASLDDATSVELGRRFAALPYSRQVELWRMANQQVNPRDLGGRQRDVAMHIATMAGWPELADAWAR